MATKSKTLTKANPKTAQRTTASPKSLAIASRGVATSRDFASLMSAIMSDLIEGAISPAVGNATCNAGGKLLKMVEMQHKYGKPTTGSSGQPKELLLTEPLQTGAPN